MAGEGKEYKKAATKVTAFMVEEGGFEPPKRNATDLQSAPFGHSGTLPYSVLLPGVPEPRYAGLGGRRSSGVSKFCRLRRNERFVADSDVELVDGLEPPTC